MEKIIQYLIVIGSANQPSERNSHLLCKICSQNISKVSCGNRNIDRFPLPNFSCRVKFRICVHVIYNLRNQTADIDRIG